MYWCWLANQTWFCFSRFVCDRDYHHGDTDVSCLTAHWGDYAPTCAPSSPPSFPYSSTHPPLSPCNLVSALHSSLVGRWAHSHTVAQDQRAITAEPCLVHQVQPTEGRLRHRDVPIGTQQLHCTRAHPVPSLTFVVGLCPHVHPPCLPCPGLPPHATNPCQCQPQ